METAKTLINDALLEIQAHGAEQPIESVDFQTARRYLNRMMAAYAADGINLGFTTVNAPTDAITVPLGAIEGMVYNLALKLATTFAFQVDGVLAAKAADGVRIMTKISTQISPTSFPDTLPIGSGNEGDTFDDNKFYGRDSDTVDTESGGVIGLEQLP